MHQFKLQPFGLHEIERILYADTNTHTQHYDCQLGIVLILQTDGSNNNNNNHKYVCELCVSVNIITHIVCSSNFCCSLDAVAADTECTLGRETTE